MKNFIFPILLVLILAFMSVPAIEASERIRIQLTPLQQTTLSAEIAAKISGLPLREGDSFTEGQVLTIFDCSIHEAQMNKASATAEAARQTLKVNTRLAELGSISSLELDQSAAKVKETEAELAAMTTIVSKCTVKAPFSGRLAKLYVENHQYMTPGKPIMDIIDMTHLEARLIVPSRWLLWLKVGGVFTIHIDELNRSYRARVIRLSPRIDPVSRTIPMTGRIEGLHPELLPGMSGWAIFAK